MIYIMIVVENANFILMKFDAPMDDYLLCLTGENSI